MTQSQQESLILNAASQTASPWSLYSARQRWVYLAVLFLVSTCNYVDRNVISVLLEPIKAEFHVSDTRLGLLSGVSFALFYATLGIPVARWADRGDRKLVITLAVVIWSLMTVVCGFAKNFWQLALARVGVGAGESGSIPPAQSLIADYFAPASRGRALALFIASATAGYLIGFTGGAHLAAAHGWRSAFIVMGAPGLLLALLAHFTLDEPRGRASCTVERPAQETLGATLRVLAAKRAFRQLVYATIVYFLIAYGAVVFFPSYMIRMLHTPLTSVGTYFGVVSTVTALTGTLLGGVALDRLTRRCIAWVAWLPALGLVVCLPLYELMLLAPTFKLCLVFAGIAGLVLSAAVPALFAVLHEICGNTRRAMAVAILFFFANLIGLGLGPVIAGALSDGFSHVYGPVGIRYALMLVMTLLLPAAWLLYRCGHHVVQDREP